MKQIIPFSDIVITGLVAGTIFGIWLGYNPKDLSALTYVEQQQNAFRALNLIMSILGLLAIVLTASYAAISKRDSVKRNILTLATLLLITSGLITRFGNQPINDIVMGWDLQDIPVSWQILRDEWWMYHGLRTVTAVLSFIMIVWATLAGKGRG